jgi:hypothetical protein
MAKVALNSEEWYPVYDVVRDLSGGHLVDIDEELLADYERKREAHRDALDRLADAFDAALSDNPRPIPTYPNATHSVITFEIDVPPNRFKT